MKNSVAFLLSVIFVVTLLCALPIHGESEIYDSVLRLHVIANSDTQEDQELKLRVRDAILTASEDMLKSATTREEAATLIWQNIDALTNAAEQEIARCGYDYPVNITLSQEEYPTKSYESFCFPSGEYLSLRVMIGNSSGQNWWCVLFPPLCLSAATEKRDAEDAFIAAGLTGEQYKIITETDNVKYTARFKILEVLEDAKKYFG
jgi:stage II sporulation protein R